RSCRCPSHTLGRWALPHSFLPIPSEDIDDPFGPMVSSGGPQADSDTDGIVEKAYGPGAPLVVHPTKNLITARLGANLGEIDVRIVAAVLLGQIRHDHVGAGGIEGKVERSGNVAPMRDPKRVDSIHVSTSFGSG